PQTSTASSSSTCSPSAFRRCVRKKRRNRVRMVGIASHGAYIPMPRLSLAAISGGGRKAAAGSGERSVAYYDEDSVTMAVAAATNCLEGLDREVVDGVLFASTSYAYKEKQAATIVAKALDLRRDVAT